MKRIIAAAGSLLMLLTLAACHDTEPANQTKSMTAKSSVVHQKTASSKTQKTVTASSKKTGSKLTDQSHEQVSSTNAATTRSMDFAKIKQGNYQDLAGEWRLLGTKARMGNGRGLKFTSGGTDTLSVSSHSLNNGAITLQGTQLMDDAGNHPVNFTTKDKVLTASLSDASKIAINWSIQFYPKGTTSEYKTSDSSSTNTENMIVIWTSNNQYTQIFAQTAKQNESVTSTTKLNIAQLSENNFTSLVGQWKNTAGKTITVTDRVINKPENSRISAVKGAAVSGADIDGQPKVVVSGPENNGVISGGIGYYASESGLDILKIVPKGIRAANTDDSNINKDRLIYGGGQGGYATKAYYRD